MGATQHLVSSTHRLSSQRVGSQRPKNPKIKQKQRTHKSPKKGPSKDPIPLPDGITKPEFDSRDARARAWARYQRGAGLCQSLKKRPSRAKRTKATENSADESTDAEAKATEGKPPQVTEAKPQQVTETIALQKRNEKCQPEILQKNTGYHEQQYYFAVWMGHDKDWGAVQIVEEHYSLRNRVIFFLLAETA